MNKKTFDLIITIGPVIMMKFVVETAKPYNIPVTVSMNPIMIDSFGHCIRNPSFHFALAKLFSC